MCYPRAIRHGETTYIGWFKPVGGTTGDPSGWEAEVGISAYSHDTTEIEHYTLAEIDFVDDHSAPGIHRRDDGHLVAVWNPRGGNSHDTSAFYVHISENPDDISSWQEPIVWDGPQDVNSYTSIVKFDGELRVYYRSNESLHDVWRYAYSTDGGETWSNPQPWVDFTQYKVQYDDRPGTHRVYPRWAKEERDDGPNRLHMAFGGYRHVDQSVRHWYLEDGTYYDSHGNQIGTESEGLDSWDNITKVWDGTDDHWTDSPFLNGLVVHDGEPYIIFEDIKEVSDDGASGDYRARWARFDSDTDEWVVGSEIADLGRALPESGPNPGLFHKGGVGIDVEDPSTVFVSIERDDRNYQIEEYTTNDDGNTWTHVRTLSGAGPQGRTRPHGKRGGVISPSGHDGQELRVLWWAGWHDRYNAYNAVVETEDTLKHDSFSVEGDLLTIGGGVTGPQKW